MVSFYTGHLQIQYPLGLTCHYQLRQLQPTTVRHIRQSTDTEVRPTWNYRPLEIVSEQV